MAEGGAGEGDGRFVQSLLSLLMWQRVSLVAGASWCRQRDRRPACPGKRKLALAGMARAWKEGGEQQPGGDGERTMPYVW